MDIFIPCQTVYHWNRSIWLGGCFESAASRKLSTDWHETFTVESNEDTRKVSSALYSCQLLVVHPGHLESISAKLILGRQERRRWSIDTQHSYTLY